MPISKLTDMQKQYCVHKHVGMAGNKAAVQAGYRTKNVDVTVAKLNKNPKIIAEIARLGEIRPQISADQIIIPVEQLDAAFLAAASHDQTIKDLERQSAAILTKAWITARHMRTVQIALGELPTVSQTTTETDEEDDNGNPVLDDNGDQRVRRKRVKTTEISFDLHAATAGLARLTDLNAARERGDDAAVLEGELAVPRKTVDTDALVAGFRVGSD